MMMIEKFEDDYNNCTIRYGDMKKQLAEDMVKFISPIREKVNAILNDEKYLTENNEKGRRKSKRKCRRNYEASKEAMGLNYF